MMEYIRHNRLRLALHKLKHGNARALLLLHGLGERSPIKLAPEYADWPGPVYALDFTGHGASDVPKGGGYSCEFLMADADAALAHLQCATIVGRGLGAYVGLLLAGARPLQVRGVILRDGPGLAGGGSSAKSPYIPVVDTRQPAPPDPYAIADLSTDARPPAYACHYARLAMQYSGLTQPISLCIDEPADWLMEVANLLPVKKSSLIEALRGYALLPGGAPNER